MNIITNSRRRISCAAALLIAFVITNQPILKAQPAENAGEGPVIVVTLGSVNKLMQDVNYVSGMVGQPQAGGIFSMMAGTFTQGIDTTQPIAVIVPLVEGMPQPLALIPTADVKTVLKRLEAQTGPVDELKDGTLVIAVGVNTIYIRQQGDWAIIAPDRDVLNLAPSDPASLFGEDADQNDLAIKLKMQQIPMPIRSMITSQMRLGFEQAMAQQNGGADAEASQEMAEASLEQIEQLITDTDELELGFNVDQTAKAISFRLRFTAVEDSALGKTLSSQKAIPSAFSSVIRPDAAMFYHSASSVSPELAMQTKASMESVKTSFATVIETQGDLPPNLQSEITKYFNQILDLATASMEEGKSDLGAMLIAGENTLQFAMGGFVSDGNEVASIAKEIAAKLDSVPDAPSFSFDRGVHKDVTLHLVEIEVPAYEAEARAILGSNFKIHIGTGEQSVYLAMGKGSKKLLTEMIDAAGSDSSANRPVGQMQFKLLPMMEFTQSLTADDSIKAMIDSLSRSTDSGKMTIVTDNVPNGQEFKISIGEGLMQAVGAAARQAQLDAQQNAIQAGQF
ncbi:MAG: hypothetical protein ACPHL6_08615 [Rubripirellula sp.]